MDLTLSDVRFALMWLVLHTVILLGAWLVIRSYAPRLVPLYRKWSRRRVAVLSLGAFLLVSANATSVGLAHDRLWQAASKRNILGLNVTSLIDRQHPDIASLQETYASTKASPDMPAAAPQPVASPKSILVIAIEGLNPAYVNAETMPFFTKLKAQGLSFENHYSSGNNTLLGTLGLLYGQSPTFFFEQTARGQKSLFIESLNSAGFKTKVFGRGLDSYRKMDAYLTNFSEPVDTKEDTDTTIAHISSFIQSNPKTFSYYYYGGTHHPYNHGPAFTKFRPEVADDYEFIGGDVYRNRVAIRNKYRNALFEADHNLELLFSKIDWRHMIIVITGDHGEAMFENGRLSHSSSLERPQTRTVLALYYPGIHPGQRTKTTSHLDILPTAFELDGLEIPKGAQGSSLLDDTPGMALVMHNNQNYRPGYAALISGRVKVIADLEQLRSPRIEWLYHDDDSDARLSQVEGDVETDFAEFKRRFELNSCGLYNQLISAGAKTASDRILLNNLRYCHH